MQARVGVSTGLPASRGVARVSQQRQRRLTALRTQAASSKNPSIWEVMRFNGSPELVNGRLAMVALLVAAHNEVATGETVMQQFASAPLLSYLAFGVLVYASLVPMMKGARHEAFGFFTPRAEYANARAAMLGFAVLLALEHHAGVPFF